MTDTTPAGSPSLAEIAALTARLRTLSDGAGADPVERAAFLADKDALIARITTAADTADPANRARARSRDGFAAAQAARDALTETVLARAATDGYVLVGPSARTWRRDPDTGQPTVAVPDAEHQTVRELLHREQLDTTEPGWVTGPDGCDDIHSTVQIADTTDSDSDDDLDDDLADGDVDVDVDEGDGSAGDAQERAGCPDVRGEDPRSNSTHDHDAAGGDRVDPVDRARHAVDALPEPAGRGEGAAVDDGSGDEPGDEFDRWCRGLVHTDEPDDGISGEGFEAPDTDSDDVEEWGR